MLVALSIHEYVVVFKVRAIPLEDDLVKTQYRVYSAD